MAGRNPVGVHAAFASVVAKTALAPAEVRKFLRKARSPSYWRKLNPQLSVSDTMSLSNVRAKPIGSAARRNALHQLSSDGYFQLESVYPLALVQRLRQGIENLRKAAWPPVFAYLYDEYWIMKRIPSLVGLIDDVLGPDHLELRNNWAHYIHPTPGAHGWSPHVDGPFLSGRISMWFPLSDATLDNGCIYIVPEGRLPGKLVETFRSRRTLTSQEMGMLMQSARALPVSAGSILGWNFRVLHWGSMAGHSTQPRVSVATEYVSKDAKGRAHDCAPLDAHDRIPSFDVRLEVIGRAIQLFHFYEPRMLRYTELASHLWKE